MKTNQSEKISMTTRNHIKDCCFYTEHFDKYDNHVTMIEHIPFLFLEQLKICALKYIWEIYTGDEEILT